MAAVASTAASAGGSAPRRLVVARNVLILGWSTLIASLFMNMGTMIVGWDQKPHATWAAISWFFRPPYWGGNASIFSTIYRVSCGYHSHCRTGSLYSAEADLAMPNWCLGCLRRHAFGRFILGRLFPRFSERLRG